MKVIAAVAASTQIVDASTTTAGQLDQTCQTKLQTKLQALKETAKDIIGVEEVGEGEKVCELTSEAEDLIKKELPADVRAQLYAAVGLDENDNDACELITALIANGEDKLDAICEKVTGYVEKFAEVTNEIKDKFDAIPQQDCVGEWERSRFSEAEGCVNGNDVFIYNITQRATKEGLTCEYRAFQEDHRDCTDATPKPEQKPECETTGAWEDVPIFNGEDCVNGVKLQYYLENGKSVCTADEMLSSEGASCVNLVDEAGKFLESGRKSKKEHLKTVAEDMLNALDKYSGDCCKDAEDMLTLDCMSCIKDKTKEDLCAESGAFFSECEDQSADKPDKEHCATPGVFRVQKCGLGCQGRWSKGDGECKVEDDPIAEVSTERKPALEKALMRVFTVVNPPQNGGHRCPAPKPMSKPGKGKPEKRHDDDEGSRHNIGKVIQEHVKDTMHKIVEDVTGDEESKRLLTKNRSDEESKGDTKLMRAGIKSGANNDKLSAAVMPFEKMMPSEKVRNHAAKDKIGAMAPPLHQLALTLKKYIQIQREQMAKKLIDTETPVDTSATLITLGYGDRTHRFGKLDAKRFEDSDSGAQKFKDMRKHEKANKPSAMDLVKDGIQNVMGSKGMKGKRGEKDTDDKKGVWEMIEATGEKDFNKEDLLKRMQGSDFEKLDEDDHDLDWDKDDLDWDKDDLDWDKDDLDWDKDSMKAFRKEKDGMDEDEKNELKDKRGGNKRGGNKRGGNKGGRVLEGSYMESWMELTGRNLAEDIDAQKFIADKMLYRAEYELLKKAEIKYHTAIKEEGSNEADAKAVLVEEVKAAYSSLSTLEEQQNLFRGYFFPKSLTSNTIKDKKSSEQKDDLPEIKEMKEKSHEAGDEIEFYKPCFAGGKDVPTALTALFSGDKLRGNNRAEKVMKMRLMKEFGGCIDEDCVNRWNNAVQSSLATTVTAGLKSNIPEGTCIEQLQQDADYIESLKQSIIDAVNQQRRLQGLQELSEQKMMTNVMISACEGCATGETCEKFNSVDSIEPTTRMLSSTSQVVKPILAKFMRGLNAMTTAIITVTFNSVYVSEDDVEQALTTFTSDTFSVDLKDKINDQLTTQAQSDAFSVDMKDKENGRLLNEDSTAYTVQEVENVQQETPKTMDVSQFQDEIENMSQEIAELQQKVIANDAEIAALQAAKLAANKCTLLLCVAAESTSSAAMVRNAGVIFGTGLMWLFM